ncbi:MAG: hypothetical protein V3W09_00210 [Nitrososphaerales archaeon]
MSGGSQSLDEPHNGGKWQGFLLRHGSEESKESSFNSLSKTQTQVNAQDMS